jgi:hypothetical protein
VGKVTGYARLVGDLVVSVREADTRRQLAEPSMCVGRLTAAAAGDPARTLWTTEDAGGAQVAYGCGEASLVTTGTGPDAVAVLPAMKVTPAGGVDPARVDVSLAAFGADGTVRVLGVDGRQSSR